MLNQSRQGRIEPTVIDRSRWCCGKRASNDTMLGGEIVAESDQVAEGAIFVMLTQALKDRVCCIRSALGTRRQHRQTVTYRGDEVVEAFHAGIVGSALD